MLRFGGVAAVVALLGLRAEALASTSEDAPRHVAVEHDASMVQTVAAPAAPAAPPAQMRREAVVTPAAALPEEGQPLYQYPRSADNQGAAAQAGAAQWPPPAASWPVASKSGSRGRAGQTAVGAGRRAVQPQQRSQTGPYGGQTGTYGGQPGGARNPSNGYQAGGFPVSVGAVNPSGYKVSSETPVNAAQDPGPPHNIQEAMAEVQKLEQMVEQAELQAGLPDTIATTPPTYEFDPEPQREENGIISACLLAAVLVCLAGIVYEKLARERAKKAEQANVDKAAQQAAFQAAPSKAPVG